MLKIRILTITALNVRLARKPRHYNCTCSVIVQTVYPRARLLLSFHNMISLQRSIRFHLYEAFGQIVYFDPILFTHIVPHGFHVSCFPQCYQPLHQPGHTSSLPYLTGLVARRWRKHQSAGAADNRTDETGHRSHPEGADTQSC